MNEEAELLEQPIEPVEIENEGVIEEKSDTPPLVDDFAEVPGDDNEVDYAALVESDMRELTLEFSPNEPIKITDLKNPARYGALRDLGLTPKEAYLASGSRIERADNRAHLSSSVPRNMTSSFSEIPRAHMDMARELFGDMSDGEIKNLYRKVTQ